MSIAKLGLVFSLFLFQILSSVVWADNIRCGTKLVGVGSTKVDVLMRCGEPLLKEHLRVLESGGSSIIRNPAIASSSSLTTNNSSKISTSDQRRVYSSSYENVERWTYNFGKGKLLKMFIFTGGQLSAIEDGERMN